MCRLLAVLLQVAAPALVPMDVETTRAQALVDAWADTGDCRSKSLYYGKCGETDYGCIQFRVRVQGERGVEGTCMRPCTASAPPTPPPPLLYA